MHHVFSRLFVVTAPLLSANQFAGNQTGKGFAPFGGTARSSALLTGTNFTCAMAVRLNRTVGSSRTVDCPEQITVVAPIWVRSGTLRERTSGSTATSPLALVMSNRNHVNTTVEEERDRISRIDSDFDQQKFGGISGQKCAKDRRRDTYSDFSGAAGHSSIMALAHAIKCLSLALVPEGDAA